MPIQKGSGYMVMSSESALNTQLPCAKNKLWNTANSPSKSMAAHIPKMAKIAIVPKPAQSKTVPNVLLPLAHPTPTAVSTAAMNTPSTTGSAVARTPNTSSRCSIASGSST